MNSTVILFALCLLLIASSTLSDTAATSSSLSLGDDFTDHSLDLLEDDTEVAKVEELEKTTFIVSNNDTASPTRIPTISKKTKKPTYKPSAPKPTQKPTRESDFFLPSSCSFSFFRFSFSV
jgi:hypothetical protein